MDGQFGADVFVGDREGINARFGRLGSISPGSGGTDGAALVCGFATEAQAHRLWLCAMRSFVRMQRQRRCPLAFPYAHIEGWAIWSGITAASKQ